MDRQPMTSAATLYQSVINDVVGAVRESFLDEGVDENVLLELKNLWQQKLEASKAVDNQNHHNDANILDSKMAAMRRAGGGNTAGMTGQMGANNTGAGVGTGGAPPQTLVISDPNKLVPVQITIPPQANNPNSQPRALTVQVPAHALQSTSNSGSTLQTVLTNAIASALTYPEEEAAKFLQQHINAAFRLT